MLNIQIDFGKTAHDYSMHRAGFPEAFFERLTAFGIGIPGQYVLDLGTGTGTMARGLAWRGCCVVGLDLAGALMAKAKQLDRRAGVTVNHINATAERTGLAATSFDVVTAGQCWHWFDRPRATQEVRRLLRPGGWLVIAHYDWLPLRNTVVEATERLIEQHNPNWHMGRGTGLYPAWLTDVAIAGFLNPETFSFDAAVAYSHEGWRGRIRASAGVAASLRPEQVTRFDRALSHLLAERFPAEPLSVPHRVFAVVCRQPS